jgi:hypothetical protein
LRKAGFLRERYEFHLAVNKSKPAARKQANRDMMEIYGSESGFSDQELQDVLTWSLYSNSHIYRAKPQRESQKTAK